MADAASVLSLLDKLTEKDKVIRELREKVNSRDALIRKLHSDLAQERSKNEALQVAIYESNESQKRKANGEDDPSTSSEPPTKKKQKSALQQEEWDDFIRQLQEFKEEKGHVMVSRSYKKHPKLARFVDTQRQRYRTLQQEGEHVPGKAAATANLTPERITQLESLGFVWKVGSTGRDLKWEERYNQLKEFKQKEGHTRVPTSYNFSLHNWIGIQRSYYKNTILGRENQPKLSTERIAKLQLLEFEWEVAEEEKKSAWETRFCDLLSFKAQHGHVRVPREYKPNIKLGNWVKEQRKNYKSMKNGKSRRGLTDERIRRLEEVGFEWRILPYKKEDDGTEEVTASQYRVPRMRYFQGEGVSAQQQNLYDGRESSRHGITDSVQL